MSWLHNLGVRFGRALRRTDPEPPSRGPKMEDRPLTREERNLLTWLIEHGSPEAHRFAAQLERARVVGSCGCGCPTIDLGIDGAPATHGASQILADFVGTTREGWQVGVLLHCRKGTLSELEIYNLSEPEGRFSLPEISTLIPFASC